MAKAHELDERLTGEGGDFFESVPGGADMYVLSMILHDWDDEQRVASSCATSPRPRRPGSLGPRVRTRGPRR